MDSAPPDSLSYSYYRSGTTFRPSSALADSGPHIEPQVSVAAMLDSGALRLPDTTQFKEYKYHIRFSPDFVARPTVGYSRDNFGNGVFGGTAISLSDMVGNNHLAFALSINGRLADAQGLAAYTNLSHRLQYAVGYQQSPFYFGEGSQFLDNGDGTLTEQDVIARYLDREAFAIGIYPLNRFTRFELGLTLADLERSFLVFSQVVDQFGLPARQMRRRTKWRAAASTTWSPASPTCPTTRCSGTRAPIYGRRYRFGVTPALGQFQWLGLLGDYRRYDAILFSYLTIATRLTANLSYGRDADSLQKYLGYSDLIRGYDDQSFAITNAQLPGDGQQRAAMQPAARQQGGVRKHRAALSARARRARGRDPAAADRRRVLLRRGHHVVQRAEGGVQARQPGQSRERPLAVDELRLRASRESLQLRDPAMGLRDSEGFSRTTRILAILVVSDVLIA